MKVEPIDVVRHYDGADNMYIQYASEYGEPGYGYGPVMLGNWWCHDKTCKHTHKFGTYDNGQPELHSIQDHHPRVWKYLVHEEDVEVGWDDEWWIDDRHDKAYRTTADSYHWQSSIMFSETVSDWITPDDDIEEWIAEVVNNPRKCLSTHVWSDRELGEVGFTELECGFESGWHEGQNDDPKEITDQIRAMHGDNVDIVFRLSQVQQFDIHFCVWVRFTEGGEND